MFTVFSRIINYGLNGFWRNGWPSAATVAMMVLSLIVSMGLILFNVFTSSAVDSIQDKIDVAVYFKTSTPEDEILRVKQSLESFPEVKGVEYISSAQALEIFREKHKDDVTIRQAVDELNSNPLQAALNIKAHRADQYEKIDEYLKNTSISQSFAGTTYFRNKDVINRLITIITNVNRGGFVLTLMLALLAGLVVFNTIRLAIYSNREEIFVMRSVGASNALVRGPYVVEGVMAGILAVVLSVLISAPMVYVANPFFKVLIPELDLFQYFYTHILLLIGYQLVFGVVIGGLSSFIAVRRYLKN